MEQRVHKTGKVSFKAYHQGQALLFPPNLGELVPADHPARLVNSVIDGLDLTALIASYKGGGCSSFHPKMLLKVLVYGYMNNIYSSRRLEKAVKENVPMMWLTGMSQPDHHTINRFRGVRLEGQLHKIFDEVVLLMVEEGQISLKQSYTDGTKIEANANKYTFVWKKSIGTNREKIKKQLSELWEYAKEVATEELAGEEPGLQKVDAEKVSQTIDRINEALKDKPIDKKKKQKLNYAKKNWPGKLAEYEAREEILGERNSYSKTDTDATFMRMKDDHMGNGQLKPAYNWQATTTGQCIIGYSLHQNTTDTTVYKQHLETIKEGLGQLPESNCADAGYGSEENYQYLEKEKIEAFVKYNYFHKEKSKKWQEDPFRVQNLHYNPKKNCYYCPMGQQMTFAGKYSKETKTGFKQKLHRYTAWNCQGCPLRGRCHKGKGNRTIEVNHRLNAHRKKVREKLESKQGRYHRSMRPQEVEAVFGIVKQNHHFRRFLCRGMAKVENEIGLVCLAHNLRKRAAWLKERKNSPDKAKKQENQPQTHQKEVFFQETDFLRNFHLLAA
jgi:transposase